MKLNLVSFGPEDFDSRSRAGIPKLHIGAGRFALSKPVKEITGLSLDDTVMMHQDQDDPTIWYLSKEPKGFPLKNSKGGTSLAFHSQPFMQTIFEAFQEEKSITFIMDEEPVKFNGKSYWKFSLEGSEEEAEEIQTDTADDKSRGPKSKNGRGRKRESKNKPKEIASDFTHQ